MNNLYPPPDGFLLASDSRKLITKGCETMFNPPEEFETEYEEIQRLNQDEPLQRN